MRRGVAARDAHRAIREDALIVDQMSDDFLERPFARRVTQTGNLRVGEIVEQTFEFALLRLQRRNCIVAFDARDVFSRVLPVLIGPDRGRPELMYAFYNPAMQKINAFLWFNDNAEEAARFYVSVFKNSKMGNIARYGDAGPGPKGSVMVVDFEIAGQRFSALNGGPQFKFNESVSFVVNCDTQKEIDEYWSKLTADGGQPIECGWLKDKFGVFWQIVPTFISTVLDERDQAKTDCVMKEVLTMKKLDLARLQKAAQG